MKASLGAGVIARGALARSTRAVAFWELISTTELTSTEDQVCQPAHRDWVKGLLLMTFDLARKQ